MGCCPKSVRKRGHEKMTKKNFFTTCTDHFLRCVCVCSLLQLCCPISMKCTCVYEIKMFFTPPKNLYEFLFMAISLYVIIFLFLIVVITLSACTSAFVASLCLKIRFPRFLFTSALACLKEKQIYSAIRSLLLIDQEINRLQNQLRL